MRVIKGWFYKKINNNENSVHIYIETKAKELTCPCCGTTTSCVHDYRTQKIKDILIIPYPKKIKNVITLCFFTMMI